MRRGIAQAAFALIAGFGSIQAAPMLTLAPPDGFVTTAPGATTGWGFTFTNDTQYYLLVDASYFCQPGEDPLFTTCTQTIGAYTDYIAANTTLISPFGSSSQPFNSTAMLGVGAYTIDPATPLYTVDSGNIVVTYQEYQGNPFTNGTQFSGDIEVSAAASIEAVPEPATITLAGGALLALAARRRKRR